MLHIFLSALAVQVRFKCDRLAYGPPLIQADLFVVVGVAADV